MVMVLWWNGDEVLWWNGDELVVMWWWSADEVLVKCWNEVKWWCSGDEVVIKWIGGEVVMKWWWSDKVVVKWLSDGQVWSGEVWSGGNNDLHFFLSFLPLCLFLISFFLTYFSLSYISSFSLVLNFLSYRSFYICLLSFTSPTLLYSSLLHPYILSKTYSPFLYSFSLTEARHLNTDFIFSFKLLFPSRSSSSHCFHLTWFPVLFTFTSYSFHPIFLCLSFHLTLYDLQLLTTWPL